MQKLGWIYIVCYCIDALMSLVATLVPSVEMASNLISMMMVLFGVLVLVFTCMDSLRPRKVFIVMLSFNALMLLFGVILGVLLFAVYGLEAGNMDITIQTYGDTFAWYWPVHWSFMTLWIAVCGYAAVAYSRFMSRR